MRCGITCAMNHLHLFQILSADRRPHREEMIAWPTRPRFSLFYIPCVVFNIQNCNQPSTVPVIRTCNQLFCVQEAYLHKSSLDQAQIPPHRCIQNLQSRSCRFHFRKDCPPNTHPYLQVIRSVVKTWCIGRKMDLESENTFLSIGIFWSLTSCFILILSLRKECMCLITTDL